MMTIKTIAPFQHLGRPICPAEWGFLISFSLAIEETTGFHSLELDSLTKTPPGNTPASTIPSTKFMPKGPCSLPSCWTKYFGEPGWGTDLFMLIDTWKYFHPHTIPWNNVNPCNSFGYRIRQHDPPNQDSHDTIGSVEFRDRGTNALTTGWLAVRFHVSTPSLRCLTG
ncbi:hypothetical protein [Verrucomicrobium spinosum]|uniref:hypothetical protein n=1 Tax=Verrucomicrobium spinosum TaxID=2736 RepID=UPI0018DC59CB|nr:hypothetical protein [Verrucomicrobium spinosum]